MSMIESIRLRVDDMLNAVMVRELRQALNSRLAMGFFVLFLLVAVMMVSGVMLMDGTQGVGSSSGERAFALVYSALMLACVGVLPCFVMFRTSAEWRKNTMDLMYATSLTPGAIVRGKFFSAMALVVLFFSVCLPFMALTYFLRGIDIPTIFLLLLLGLLVSSVMTLGGIFAGYLPVGQWFLAGPIILFVFSFQPIMFFSSNIIDELFGSGYGTAEFWFYFCFALVLMVMIGGTFYVFATALISPGVYNRSMLPRLYVTLCWAVSMVYLMIHAPVGDAFYFLSGFFFGGLFLLFMLIGVSVNDHEVSLRVRRQIPRNWLLRLLVFPFYSGGANGVVWTLMLLLGTYGIFLFKSGYGAGGVQDWRYMHGMYLTYGYLVVYVLAALFLRRILKGLISARMTWIVCILLIGVLAVASMVISILVDEEVLSSEWTVWDYVNPFGPIYHSGRQHLMMTHYEKLITVGMIVGLGLNVPWFWGQLCRFKPIGEASQEVVNGHGRHLQETVIMVNGKRVIGLEDVPAALSERE